MGEKQNEHPVWLYFLQAAAIVVGVGVSLVSRPLPVGHASAARIEYALGTVALYYIVITMIFFSLTRSRRNRTVIAVRTSAALTLLMIATVRTLDIVGVLGVQSTRTATSFGYMVGSFIFFLLLNLDKIEDFLLDESEAHHEKPASNLP